MNGADEPSRHLGYAPKGVPLYARRDRNAPDMDLEISVTTRYLS
ncbi:MAG: hypothetical protein SVP52_05870 [Chloroflexota bacterium]|nr:hypothetical protein [Chloroflexota bacterium]